MRSIDAVWERSEPIYINKRGKDPLKVLEEDGTETWFLYDKSQVSEKQIINEAVGKFLISYFRDGNIKIKGFCKEIGVHQNVVIMKFKDGKMLDGYSLISFYNDIIISAAYFENNDTVKTISCFKHGEIKVGTYNGVTSGLSIHPKGGSFYTGYSAELESLGPTFT
jgi:hypothetical protein